MIRNIVCDECSFEFKLYSLDEETTDTGDTEISFSCPSCMYKYHVTYTNEYVEGLKRTLKERIEEVAEARELDIEKGTKSSKGVLTTAKARREIAQENLEKAILELEERNRGGH